MALKINQQAPDFTLPSTTGKQFTLSQDAKGLPCILYFYPKDFTPGCTREACEFRDSFEVFKDSDIAIYGISRDDIPTHLKFKEKHNLPFQLLADEEGKVSGLYDANIPLLNYTKRVTYLLDKNHKIATVYTNMFAATNHIKEMVLRVKTSLQD
ncbi:MAG: peroxiredoxin [Bacteroidota bacterium]|nr:peroxiredoxin [Bacteroidota bacterium]